YNPDEETPVDELLKAIIAALSLEEGTTEAEAIAALTALKPALVWGGDCFDTCQKREE
ncbi:hypothetical protein, partial [Pseudomonas phage vB_Pae_BR205a]